MYIEHNGAMVVVASKGGYARDPMWVHNLRAHPRTAVQVRAVRVGVLAREATAAEREELWPLVVHSFGPFELFQQRVEREIPIFVLDRVEP
ncbi:hypothetical protein MycrhDRAFT_3664 [Mycolicibacterium rhodesiae JS60]|nr:hypothetical protein MycrhDRAFT_3664 [Mycolicibacterium rhodesiae JS60]